MKKPTPSDRLNDAIQLLEIDHAIQGQQLKDHFFLTYESLKPINLLKSTLSEISTSPAIINDLIGASIGLTGGYLSKKIFIGNSGNLIKKIFGSLLQFGVTNLIASHSDEIRSIAQYVFQKLFKKKADNTVRS